MKKELILGLILSTLFIFGCGSSDDDSSAQSDDGPKYFSSSSSGYRSCTIKWACIMCINCACVKCAHMHIGLFLDFSGSDRLDIAYYGSPKCF